MTTKQAVKKNGNGRHDDFEHQMAVQMGWSKPKLNEGTPVPLEQSKIDNFPPSKGVELVLLGLLYESPHNPRKSFKEIDSLAKSIVATGGLLQPIVARPVQEGPETRYEIAAGARRFRALELLKSGKFGPEAKQLGEKALVDIRELTDAQMAEAMMAENDQRDGLLPLEQGMGYSNMLKTGFTVETIAQKLGVSTGTVHGRLKLLDLSKKARAWLLEGRIPSSVATVLGRYPQQLQDEALQQLEDGQDNYQSDCMDCWDDDGNLKARDVLAWLQESFTKSLKSPPFDATESYDVPKECWPNNPPSGEGEKALEGKVVAPVCAKCPLNSKNMPSVIAGEVAPKHGFCCGLTCFAAKTEAALDVLRAKAKEKGDQKILSPATSEKAVEAAKGTWSNSAYAIAAQVVHGHPKNLTWGQLRSKANEKLDEDEQLRRVTAVKEEGKTELVERKEVIKALAKQGDAWAKKKLSSMEPRRHTDYQATYERQRREQEMKEKIRRELADRVLKGIVDVIKEKGPNLDALRSFYEALDGSTHYAEEHTLFGLKNRKELEAWVDKKATVNELFALLYVRTFADDYRRVYGGFGPEPKRAAAVLKLNLAKLEADGIAATKAAQKAEGKKKGKKGEASADDQVEGDEGDDVGEEGAE